MKNISKYKKSIRINRIVHVFVNDPNEGKDQPLRIEINSGEPNEVGKSKLVPCTKEIYKAVLGEREDNKIRPGLRGDQKHVMIGRIGEIKVGDKKVEGLVGIDRIPRRYFTGNSGPVIQREHRINGFLAEWQDEHAGFKIDEGYLGLSQRDIEKLLENIRKNFGAKTSIKTECGHQVTRVDEVTLRIKNPKPYTEQSI